jgi:hypothetical protein
MLADTTIEISVTVFNLTINWTNEVGFYTAANAEAFQFTSGGLLPVGITNLCVYECFISNYITKTS